MSKLVKFATQLDAKILLELRSYAEESGRRLSAIVSEAVSEYLDRTRVRPAFRDAADEVMSEHAELLRRLAK